MRRTIFDVVPDVAVHAAPLFRQVIETGEALLGVELTGVTAAPPRQPIPVLVNASVFREAAGQVTGVFAS